MEILKMRRYMMAVAGEMWIMTHECRKYGGLARSKTVGSERAAHEVTPGQVSMRS
jgi:hypothetical protein